MDTHVDTLMCDVYYYIINTRKKCVSYIYIYCCFCVFCCNIAQISSFRTFCLTFFFNVHCCHVVLFLFCYICNNVYIEYIYIYIYIYISVTNILFDSSLSSFSTIIIN